MRYGKSTVLQEAVTPLFENYDGGSGFIYQNQRYSKLRDIGIGGSGIVSLFTRVRNPAVDSIGLSDASRQDFLVVKTERLTMGHGYCEGEFFYSEAKFNKLIYGIGEFSGNRYARNKPHYILMPYFSGELLSTVKLYSVESVVNWFIYVACFIHHKMHASAFLHPTRNDMTGLVHGDLKINNIILQHNEVKIIDFGLTVYIDDLIKCYEVPRDVNGRKQSFEAAYPHIAPELGEYDLVLVREFPMLKNKKTIYIKKNRDELEYITSAMPCSNKIYPSQFRHGVIPNLSSSHDFHRAIEPILSIIAQRGETIQSVKSHPSQDVYALGFLLYYMLYSADAYIFASASARPCEKIQKITQIISEMRHANVSQRLTLFAAIAQLNALIVKIPVSPRLDLPPNTQLPTQSKAQSAVEQDAASPGKRPLQSNVTKTVVFFPQQPSLFSRTVQHAAAIPGAPATDVG